MLDMRKNPSIKLAAVRKESNSAKTMILRTLKNDEAVSNCIKVAEAVRSSPKRILSGKRRGSFDSSDSSPKSPREIRSRKAKKGADYAEQVALSVVANLKDIESYIKSIPRHRLTFDGVTYEWSNGIYLKKVRLLGRGASFGELAFATEGAKRSATVRCETDCEFATIQKDAFTKSLQSVEQKRIRKKIDRLQQVPMFAAMSRRQVQRFLEKIEKKKFVLNQVMYAHGQPADKVYLVIDGVFEQQMPLPHK